MKRNRTLLITAPFLLVLLCLAAYQFGYMRIKSDIEAIKEKQAVQLKLLEKSNAIIAEKPNIEKHIAALKNERQADNPKLIEGQTPSLSAAALQDTVKGIVTGRGGNISSERVGKPEDYGKFRIISVSMDASLPDIKALGDVLYSIETRTPDLVVKELDVRVRNFKDPKELMVKLDISALTGGK